MFSKTSDLITSKNRERNGIQSRCPLGAQACVGVVEE